MLLFISLFLLSGLGYGQIELEHTYDNLERYPLTRIHLKTYGEKYYVVRQDENKVIFYNADHTEWKTVELPTASQSKLGVIRVVSHESLAGSKTIIGYTYHDTTSNNYDPSYALADDDGNLIQAFPDCYSGQISLLDNDNPKLLTYRNDGSSSIYITNVYSLPDLTLEKNYQSLRTVTRVLLDDGTILYYTLNGTNFELYGTDHILLKSVPITLTPNQYIFDSQIHISKKLLNSDDLIEIGYSYYEITNGNIIYSSSIVNENGVEIFNQNNSHHFRIDTTDGLTPKLITMGAAYDLPSYVYSLPSLNLEHSYNSYYVNRNNFSAYGEVYSLMPNDNFQVVEVYNNNHIKIKEIPTTITSMDPRPGFLAVLENAVDTMSGIEIWYRKEGPTYDQGTVYALNENGDILFEQEKGFTLSISRLDTLRDVFISTIYQEDKSLKANIYARPEPMDTIGDTTGIHIIKANSINIFPVPANEGLTISLDHDNPTLFRMMNLQGQIVFNKIVTTQQQIDVSRLKPGVYILEGVSDNSIIYNQKVIIE